MPKFLDYDGLEHFYDKIVSSGGLTPTPTKTSTIRVTTSEADLLGCDVTVKISGHVYVQPFPETLTDDIAEVNIVVTELGIATLSCTSAGGDEVTEAVDINAFYITAEVEFSLKMWLYKEGNEFESITGGWKSFQCTLTKNNNDMVITKPVGTIGGALTNTRYTKAELLNKYTTINCEISTNKSANIQIGLVGALMDFVSKNTPIGDNVVSININDLSVLGDRSGSVYIGTEDEVIITIHKCWLQ